VFVHRFFYQGTIEEVINDRIIGKEELSEAALESALSQDEEIFRSKAKLISPTKLR
jgi:SNF2 family DNA or RNA helicase